MNRLLCLTFPPIERIMLKWFLLGILAVASATSWAQGTIHHLERRVSIKNAFTFDRNFGIYGTPQGTIEVRMYEKARYTTGGREDTEGFLYGAYATMTTLLTLQEESWAATPSQGVLSTSFKPRFLRAWQQIGDEQEIEWNDLVGTNLSIDVVIEIEFSGNASVVDVENITLPGIGTLLPDEISRTNLRGVDFEVRRVSEVTSFAVGTETYTFSDLNTSASSMELTVPVSSDPFYKIMPGSATEFVLAKNQSQATTSWSTYPHSGVTVDIHIADAVKINNVQYSILKISKPKGNVLMLSGGDDGPYVISPDVTIQKFQQTAANEKFLNRQNHTDDILLAAHRGFWQEPNIAENTIVAYDKAIELGVDMLEVDIRKTADDKYILFHDSYADRLLHFSDVDVALYKDIDITLFEFAGNVVDAESGLELRRLNSAMLKDRFGNVTSEPLLVFEDLITYIKGTPILISLDHAIEYVKPLSKMLMENDIEDYFFYKGNGKAHPDDFKNDAGILMQQIAFTPVFQEWVFNDPASAQTYDAEAYWDIYMDYQEQHNWTIPGCEVNFKKEISVADGVYGPIPRKSQDNGVSMVQHQKALAFVNEHKDNFWIGLSPWFPLFGDDPWSPEEPTGSKNFAPIYDWRADMSFCIDYCHLNYFITDHPKYTINYWNSRSGN